MCRLAPDGWKEKHEVQTESQEVVMEEKKSQVGIKKQRSTWAKLIKKVYGCDPLVCPKCESEMKIIAVIMDPTEIEKILQHLVKIGCAPPGLDLTNLNN
ncbi:MAG: hypothetical protein JW976_14675 [Syntrophaceae bacterium]|nr:hypothetical protein [Syntrophaceae bacterium]